jgi:hypothetical protein
MISGVFRTVIGLFFGILCALVLSPAFAAFNSKESSVFLIASLIIVLGVAALGLFAPSIRRTFGRGFLLLGVCFFALPFSTMLLSGRAASEVVAASSQGDQAATAVGAGVGAVLMTGVGTFLGVTFGIIFLVLGLVLALGGRREVIVVSK